MLSEVLRKADLVVTAGVYSTNEAQRAAGRELPVVVVPPGVDPTRFTPVTADQRRAARAKYGLTHDQPVVLGLSRLVPRKGLDTVIQATAMLARQYPDLQLLIAGSGRDRRRLERLAAQHAAPVRFLGRVPEEDLPQLYAMSDVFTMLCRTRWRGLEQEGFGIVFLEAAASGVPQIAGNSGGAAEAVQHGVTGFVVHDPTSVTATAQHLGELLADPERASAMGRAGRERAIEAFSYDTLAVTLRNAISATIDRLGQAANEPA